MVHELSVNVCMEVCISMSVFQSEVSPDLPLRIHLYPTDGIQAVAGLSDWPWLDDCCLATAENDEILSNPFSLFSVSPFVS